MAYKNVCKSVGIPAAAVRHDRPGIILEILRQMDEPLRNEMLRLRFVNRDQFDERMKIYRSENPERVSALMPNHDAGGTSPGIERFVAEVIRNPSLIAVPPRPEGFPINVAVQTYPGRYRSDISLEGRAADVYFQFNDPRERIFGDWLFDHCVQNCAKYQIQVVIFGSRQWGSEENGGRIMRRISGDHFDHVHIEMNCGGANPR
ncbi:MAG: hypothetical protein KDB79_13960 [Acidobacteria bacterium]|nr:hypothetical protein [Acidobacteriota bacterium]